MRLRRTELGYSQAQLAERLGLTFQQVQKYERGANRVGASRLWEAANALDVGVDYFFDGLSGGNGAARGLADGEQALFGAGPEMEATAMSLLRAFAAVESLHLRRAIIGLVRALGR